jgi:hypothetical protein
LVPSNVLWRAARLSAQLCASVSYLLQILLDFCGRMRSAIQTGDRAAGRRHLCGASLCWFLVVTEALLACFGWIFEEELHFLELGFHPLIRWKPESFLERN